MHPKHPQGLGWYARIRIWGRRLTSVARSRFDAKKFSAAVAALSAWLDELGGRGVFVGYIYGGDALTCALVES